MNEDFLKYYNRELVYLRHKGSEFSEKYPKIASRLSIKDANAEDPHVTRILEGCAFLTAQMRMGLDDSYPQVTQSLMGDVFPDYHTPLPSMAIAHLTAAESETTGFELSAGQTVLVNALDSESCEFTTCYPTTVLPIEVEKATFKNAPFKGQGCAFEEKAQSVLTLTLSTMSEDIELKECNIKSLRFYLHGQQQIALSMYQKIFQSCIGFCVVQNGDVLAVYDQQNIGRVGFSRDDVMLPNQNKNVSPETLLIEYLHYPDKFRFFDVLELHALTSCRAQSVDLCLYFDDSCQWLEKQITHHNFLLGCTPIINTFTTKTEPIRLRSIEHEYRLEPEHRLANSVEMLSVDEVTVRNWNITYSNIPPYYSHGHPNFLLDSEFTWLMRREDSAWANGKDETGRDVYLSVLTTEKGALAPHENEAWYLDVTATCSNRNLPRMLPFGGGQPNCEAPYISDNLEKVELLTAPTETIRPDMKENSQWQFSGLMNMSHFAEGLGDQQLKKLISLFSFSNRKEARSLIDALVKVSFTADTARINQKGRVGFCHGTHIVVTISDQTFPLERMYFFGEILSDFFAHYAEVNAFTKLSMVLKSNGKTFHEWPARVGEKVLL